MPPTKRGTRLKRQRQSRPLSSTETAQNPGKTAVSSLLRHRDRTLRKAGRRENSTAVGRSAGFAHGTRGNDSLVPSQTPRPHKTSEKQQSRPFSDTETTQNLGKTAVSSHLKHRDRTKPRKNSSLVPSQAPRPHKSPEKQQSRPFSSTETTQNPGKTTVSSLLRHRDRTKPRKNSSLVPSQAPRQHKTPEKQQSRPFSGTETTQNPGKTAVSSHLQHRDRTLRKVGRDGIATTFCKGVAGKEGKTGRSGGAVARQEKGEAGTKRRRRDEVGKEGEAGEGRRRRDEAGREGKARRSGVWRGRKKGKQGWGGGAGAVRMSGRKEVWRRSAAAAGRTAGYAHGRRRRRSAAAGGRSAGFAPGTRGKAAAGGRTAGFAPGRRENAAAVGRSAGFAPGTRGKAAAAG